MSADKSTRKKAVALHYPEGFPAPFIACKGTGKLAEKMTDLASEYGVPVVFEPETAQLLSLQETGTYIPPETYEILAAVFAFLKEAEMYAND